MSLAYQINNVKVEKVVGLQVDGLRVGSVWKTGNVLFRAPERGSLLQKKMGLWAQAVDANGRVYLIWKAARSSASSLVIQRLDSHYCFEVSPADS